MRADDGESVAFETVCAADVAALNVFYRRGLSVRAAIAGDEHFLTPAWGLSLADAHPCSLVTFKLGKKKAALLLPRQLVETWLIRADPVVLLSRLAPEHAAMLLESYLSRELVWLEEKLGERIAIEAIGEAPPPGEVEPLTFTIRAVGELFVGALRFEDGSAAASLGRLLAEHRTGSPPRPNHVLLPVRHCFGAARISAGEMRALLPGDVVLVDDTAGEAATGLLIVADHLLAPVDRTDAGIRLGAPLNLAIGSRWEWIMEDKISPATGRDVEDVDFDGVPVALVFELGRKTMPLGELADLAPGTVVPLAEASGTGVDVIANGKRIGRGEIVRIGEAMGVRLVRILDHA
ncbi:type III secretion system cytoplasmic ring protein SctQ [Nitratireductor pacificus]|uniref:type III secretion system cytoplasmic ring protein SctQ n=1 Tax=Nitratireductor pacificus TaxID=1231180 RepID=UPI0012F6AB65|nr:type III secretion system cytoplasmic ring protein SctQ [Nitratireductor pacificus]